MEEVNFRVSPYDTSTLASISNNVYFALNTKKKKKTDNISLQYIFIMTYTIS